MRNQPGAPGAQQVLALMLTIAVVVSIRGVAPEIAAAEVEMPGVPKLKLSGEVGLRSEYIRNENFARRDATREDDTRLRWRARLRLGAGFFHIEADSVVAVYNSDDLQQTNVNSIPVELQLRLPGGVKVVWDTYIQEKVDTDLASNGGVVHGENATKVRTRLSVLGSF